MAPKTKKSTARPPFLICVAGLIMLIVITGLVGYSAVRSADDFRAITKNMQQAWGERFASKALPEQFEARQALEVDQQYLKRVVEQYQRLHHLLGFSVAGLGALILLAFITYHYALINPLRNLERSIREIAEQGLRGKVWGSERDDLYGSLARSIGVLRKDVSQLADMSVEGPDGVHLVRFSGRGAAAFNTLINDLQVNVRDLQKTGEEMREKMEHSADHWQKKAEIMGDSVMQTSSSLHQVFESTRQQLELLHGSQVGVQSDAQRMVSRFENDMEAIKEIALVTGQRVAQTLAVLNTSDRDLRFATQQNLEASDMFRAQAADLTEKLVAATNLMRASGKVMADTTESTRMRFLEAVNSVEGHGAAVRAFLAETAGKTDQIAGLYDSLAGNSQRMAEVMASLDNRVADFDTKSTDAFGRLALGASAMDEVAGRLNGTVDDMATRLNGTVSEVATRLNDAHGTLSGSMETMRNHTDMLAQILSTLREEYNQTMDSVRGTINEAAPAIAYLKQAGEHIHAQLQQEWSVYSQQSRQVLMALEEDVRALNSRTAIISQSTDSLVNDIRSQTAHLNQSANNLDLQIGAISQRIEGAVSAVIQSNQQLSHSTNQQMQDIHTAVSDMTQRLSILSQLAGTLGAVAGQLGQIVPMLSGGQFPNVTLPPDASPEVAEKFEQLNKDFQGALQNMRGEFETVRGQITRWVEAISGGYQRLAGQIGGLETMLDEKLAGIKINNLEGILEEKLAQIHILPPPSPSELVAPTVEALSSNYQYLAGQLSGLETRLDDKLAAIRLTAPTPAEFVAPAVQAIATGYQRLEGEIRGLEGALDMKLAGIKIPDLENILDEKLAKIKVNPPTPAELVVPTIEINAAEIAGRIAPSLQLIHASLADSTHADLQVVDRIDRLRAELSSLRNQVQNSSGTLNELNDMLEQGFEKLRSEDGTPASSQNLLDKLESITKELNVQTMVDAVSRLQHITQSLEKIAGDAGDKESGDEKTG